MTDLNQLTLATASSSEIVNALNKYGVVIIPNYLELEKEVVPLRNEFEQMLSTEDTTYKTKKPYSAGRCVVLERKELDNARFPKTAEVFSNPLLEEVKQAFWKEPNAELNKVIYVVHDVVGSKHVANDLHFDIDANLKFFFYLTDTTAQNGAFTCVPGSHLITRDIRKKYGVQISHKNRQLTRDLPLNGKKEIPIEGNAGSLIVFTTETWHKAGTVHAGERLAMRGHTALDSQYRFVPKVLKGIKRKLGMR